MVTESVDAYVKCDIMLAKKVIAADDVVDEQFARVKQSADRTDRRQTRQTANTLWTC